MEVEPEQAVKSAYGGRTVYFCGDRCSREFAKSPERYPALLAAAPAGAR